VQLCYVKFNINLFAQHFYLLINAPTCFGHNCWPSSGSFLSTWSLCFNLCQKFHLWLKLSLWWLNVTILKISVIAKIRLKYILQLFCCWCDCCVQTSTFQYFFKWSKFWNQISCVLCSRYEWTQNAGYLIPEITTFEERLKRRSLDETVISTAK
jgi:hypothetical protein